MWGCAVEGVQGAQGRGRYWPEHCGQQGPGRVAPARPTVFPNSIGSCILLRGAQDTRAQQRMLPLSARITSVWWCGVLTCPQATAAAPGCLENRTWLMTA